MANEKRKDVDLDAILTDYNDGEAFEDIAIKNGLSVRSLCEVLKKEAGIKEIDAPLTQKEKRRMLSRMKKQFENPSITVRWSEMQALYRNIGVLK